MSESEDAEVDPRVHRVRDLRDRLEDARRPDTVRRARERGTLTARERVAALCDPGTFSEHGGLVRDYDADDSAYSSSPADGLIAGTGSVDGRPVAVVASDFTVEGGSDGRLGMEKQYRMADLALRHGLPLVMLLEGGGHRITEGLDASGFGKHAMPFFEAVVRLSGWAPVVCSIMGPGFAGPANSSSLADFVPMVRGTSSMGIAGPALVRAATGEDLTKDELGGAERQARSGNADLVCESDEECLHAIRRYLSFLPTNASAPPPRGPTRDDLLDPVPELRTVVPRDRRRGYDVRGVLRLLVDDGELFELRPEWARNMVTGLARIDGRPVGMMANQPMHLAGAIDASAAEKAGRLLSLCSAFGLPVLSLCDTPGFLPGSGSESAALVRRSAKMLQALGHHAAGLITVVLRKAYGMGMVAMGAQRGLGNDLLLLWPEAEMSAMGIEGAVDVALREHWASADDPEKARRALVERLLERSSAEQTAAGFTVDDLIDPADTRRRVVLALRVVSSNPSRLSLPPKRHPVAPI
ncbi:MAG: acyl-CoA carboxylase [Acidimicrobiia bacterium]|nr:acyl-CoA carboxylase [Acidimicrobiia bacterium]